MFSPRTYARMFELYNEAIWPINALAAMMAFALLFITVRMRFPPSQTSASTSLESTHASTWQRILHIAIFVYFAIAHVWVALVFLRGYYAPIFWAAEYFALAFLAQALLFAIAAALAARSSNAFQFTRSTVVTIFGVSIVSLALLVHPTIHFALHSHWNMLEGVGVAPDTTAIAALGFLLLLRPNDAKNTSTRIGRPLWRTMVAIAVIACVVSLLTLIAMRSYIALIPAAALLEWAISHFFYRPVESGEKSNNDRY
jgi:Family of unknown function (DUF6064)